MQNISGGVGEAYPGSTGGEIFNCYEGGNRNQAPANYSTAIGFKNRSLAVNSFTFGSNNTNSGSCAIVGGYNNTMTAAGNYGCIFGINNNPPYGGYIIGSYNNASGIVIGNNNTNYYSSLVNGILIGDHLNYNAQASVNPIIIGHYNNYPVLSSASLIFACGTSNASINAIEISPDYTKIRNRFQLNNNDAWVVFIDTPQNPNNITTDEKTLATLGSFQKRYQSWNSTITFTPDTPKTTADLPSGFQAALYQATEAEFTGTYHGVQVQAKFRLSPNSDETLLANPVVCYNTDAGAYSHTRGFILKLEKTSSTVTITMQQGTSIDFGNNDATVNSYVDSTTTFDVSYIKLKMTAY